MSVRQRFSRKRDWSLGWHLVADGPDAQIWRRHAWYSSGTGADAAAHLHVEDPRLLGYLQRLAGEPDPVGAHAREGLARYAQLAAAARPAPPAAVLDDEALRALVHTRSVPATCLVVDELGLGASGARVDVATLSTDCWTGVELKGARDTLARLPRQVNGYSAVMDRCEVLTTAEHTAGVLELVPHWWTVTVADSDGQVTCLQPGTVNPNPSARARAELLWREEALAAVVAHAPGTRGLARATRRQLQDQLADLLDAAAMRDLVTAQLAARVDWVDPTTGRRTRPFTGVQR